MADSMFTVLLTCSDEACDDADEFVGTLGDADNVLCEGCGCLMQVVAIEGPDQRRPATVVELSAAAARRRRLPALSAAA